MTRLLDLEDGSCVSAGVFVGQQPFSKDAKDTDGAVHSYLDANDTWSIEHILLRYVIINRFAKAVLVAVSQFQWIDLGITVMEPSL